MIFNWIQNFIYHNVVIMQYINFYYDIMSIDWKIYFYSLYLYLRNIKKF